MVIVGLFGNSDYVNQDARPEDVSVAGIFGSARADLTRVQLAPGQYEVKVVACFGNVEISVPQDIGVRVNGVGMFGNIEQRQRDDAMLPDYASAPVQLCIDAAAIFGYVKIRRISRDILAGYSETPLLDVRDEMGYEGETSRLDPLRETR